MAELFQTTPQNITTASRPSLPKRNWRRQPVRITYKFDWTLRESARAKIRVMVKRILNKYGFPPDLQEEAVKTVLRQAEMLCADWAVS